MEFLKKLFNKKEEKSKYSYSEFWDWFEKNQLTFFNAVKSRTNIEEDFFNVLSPQLARIREGFFFITGMKDEHTAELIITPDGAVQNIVFVEDLINHAPKLNNWTFTALKQPTAPEGFSITMANADFSVDNIYFLPNQHDQFPDLINITIIHLGADHLEHSVRSNGCFIFLDNFLGELNLLTKTDHIQVAEPGTSFEEDLIPISKLPEYINWREKEFIEKYEGIRYNTENDNHSMLEMELENGTPIIAVINNDILEWESIASHPWLSLLEISYDGQRNNGMPDENELNLLDNLESEILNQMIDSEGNLYVGRQTGDNARVFFFASKDFRTPSKVFDALSQKEYLKEKVNFEIFKDKYWEFFSRFKVN